jgi:hypothetical protein
MGFFAMHNDFTLFFRTVPSGKNVVYYYAYDDEGNRLGPWTTGQPNKTAARNYCNRLNRQGKLLPGPKDMPTFEEYSAGFWDWDNSPYLKERKKRRKLTQAYADKNQRVVEYTLLPYFGKMKIDKITAEDIEKWFDYMIQEKYKHTTINGYYGTLKTMLVWAAKKRIISGDPFAALERLLNDRRDLKIVTEDEFKDLFVTDWRNVWGNDLLRCTANKLAALTGMRMCEVLGLKGEFVYDNEYLDFEGNKHYLILINPNEKLYCLLSIFNTFIVGIQLSDKYYLAEIDSIIGINDYASKTFVSYKLIDVISKLTNYFYTYVLNFNSEKDKLEFSEITINELSPFYSSENGLLLFDCSGEILLFDEITLLIEYFKDRKTRNIDTVTEIPVPEGCFLKIRSNNKLIRLDKIIEERSNKKI